MLVWQQLPLDLITDWTIPVVNVTRGFVGTSTATHTDGSSARIYKGAFNIVENKIHFTEAPDGKGNNDRRIAVN